MKKTILTAAIALFVMFGISRSAYATTGNPTTNTTLLTGISNINEIEVHGNVQLFISSGTKDKVKVYDDYYANNALVQEENGVLRITSYNKQKLVVWFTAANVSKLSVFDNGEIRSFGKFSAIDLAVNLHDVATAQLDMDAFTASFNLSDCTKTSLSGFVQNGTVRYTPSAQLEIANFAAANLTKSLQLRPWRHFHRNELASINPLFKDSHLMKY